jgi:hypothetical protein
MASSRRLAKKSAQDAVQVLSCGVEPQQVGTGKPNCGAVWPGGIGAGVVCSLASFCARLRPLPVPGEDFLEEERSRNSVARKYASLPPLLSSLPQARERGQRDGTTAWMALREACSPANMVAAAEYSPEVLTKMEESGFVVVRRKVDEKPELPYEVIWVLEASRERERRIEGSIEAEGDMVR